MVGSICNPSINQTTMKFYFVTEKQMIFPLFYVLGNGRTLLISCLPQVKLFHHLNNQYWLQWNLVLLTIFINNQREKRPHLCRAQSQLLRSLLNCICILTFRISLVCWFLIFTLFTGQDVPSFQTGNELPNPHFHQVPAALPSLPVQPYAPHPKISSDTPTAAPSFQKMPWCKYYISSGTCRNS